MSKDNRTALESGRTLRVLLVECDRDVARRIESSLVQWHTRRSPLGDVPICRTVTSLEELHGLDVLPFDVVVTAAALPDSCGLDVLVYMQGTAPETPVIMTGQEADAAMAIDAIRGGAAEFILLTGHERFTVPLAVEKAFVHRQLRHENEGLQEDLGRSMADLAVLNRKLEKTIRQLEVTARTDELTGLCNRRWLNLMLEGRWAESDTCGATT